MAIPGDRTAGSGAYVDGDKELMQQLAGLEGKIGRKIAQGALRRAAKKVILPEAKAMVPVDTGQLEGSLKVKALARSRRVFGVAVVAGEGFFKGEEFYGGFVEFGTKHMEADPFLRPAGYANREKVLRLVVQDVKDQIKAMRV